MDHFFSALAALQGSAIPTALRISYYGYPLVNTAHIIGIAMLFGGIAPLDLRLLGFWRTVPVAGLVRILLPMAIAGLILSVVTGALLFSVGAVRYAGLGLFQVKMLLVLAATANALLLSRASGWHKDALRSDLLLPRIRIAAGLSIGLWLAAIMCGRFIAYID